MAKILSVYEETAVIVETDNDIYPTYKRYSDECWDNLMGQSWETVSNPEKLEAMYQDWLKSNPSESSSK